LASVGLSGDVFICAYRRSWRYSHVELAIAHLLVRGTILGLQPTWRSTSRKRRRRAPFFCSDSRATTSRSGLRA